MKTSIRWVRSTPWAVKMKQELWEHGREWDVSELWDGGSQRILCKGRNELKFSARDMDQGTILHEATEVSGDSVSKGASWPWPFINLMHFRDFGLGWEENLEYHGWLIWNEAIRAFKSIGFGVKDLGSNLDFIALLTSCAIWGELLPHLWISLSSFAKQWN